VVLIISGNEDTSESILQLKGTVDFELGFFFIELLYMGPGFWDLELFLLFAK
jgi:hypothetical protein